MRVKEIITNKMQQKVSKTFSLLLIIGIKIQKKMPTIVSRQLDEAAFLLPLLEGRAGRSSHLK